MACQLSVPAGQTNATKLAFHGRRTDLRAIDRNRIPELDPSQFVDAILEAVAGDPRLRVFLGNDGIETIPAKHSRRRLLLDQIAQAFEPGVRYPERDVSLFLLQDEIGSMHDQLG